MKTETKVFCIGFNKTGTTSLNHFMEVNGFNCGNQAQGEILIRDYANSNWTPILKHCQTAQFFQDLPFSAPRTAAVLAEAFPEAMFILTERESAEIWYQSICSFHKKYFLAKENTPNADELKKSTYRYPGFAWEANRALYNSPASDPYNASILKTSYTTHNADVRALFNGKDNFLTLKIEDPLAITKLENFLGISSTIKSMPWLNKTKSIKS